MDLSVMNMLGTDTENSSICFFILGLVHQVMRILFILFYSASLVTSTLLILTAT
jgi:hypothetical protein